MFVPSLPRMTLSLSLPSPWMLPTPSCVRFSIPKPRVWSARAKTVSIPAAALFDVSSATSPALSTS